MSVETYWLLIAPAALLGLSAVAWASLWITRPTRRATPAEAKPLR